MRFYDDILYYIIVLLMEIIPMRICLNVEINLDKNIMVLQCKRDLFNFHIMS